MGDNMAIAAWRKWTSTVILSLVGLVTFVIGGLSVNFVDDPFPSDARVLITSFAFGMTVLAGVAIFALHRHASLSAWAGLWAYPVFFIWHVVALGTLVPDLVLAVVSAAGLVVAWPLRGKSEEPKRTASGPAAPTVRTAER